MPNQLIKISYLANIQTALSAELSNKHNYLFIFFKLIILCGRGLTHYLRSESGQLPSMWGDLTDERKIGRCTFLIPSPEESFRSRYPSHPNNLLGPLTPRYLGWIPIIDIQHPRRSELASEGSVFGKPYERDELLSLKSITPIDHANAVTQRKICQGWPAHYRSNLI